MKRQVSVIVKQLDCHVRLSVPRHAAKLLQLCLTLCDPIDGSPPGSPVPRILQASTLEWFAFAFSRAYTLRKPQFERTHGPQCSLQHYLQQPGHGSNLNVH